jgi:hypothetical protein
MSDARTVIAAEIFRQYKANPHWDDAKQVVECLNLDAILAALADAGLVIVPREPTHKMLANAAEHGESLWGIYRAMVRAANEQ